jgi:hypothetical protein
VALLILHRIPYKDKRPVCLIISLSFLFARGFRKILHIVKKSRAAVMAGKLLHERKKIEKALDKSKKM